MYIISKFSLEQKKANITFNIHREVLYSKVKQKVGIFSYFDRFLRIYMELVGIEPTTSCLQSRCSPS